MRLVGIIAVVGLLATGGCTANRLRQRTINQGATLSELQYEQVLSNLATFADNPFALPWHVTLREGTTQITDSASGGALLDFGPPAVTQPQLFGSRTVVAQWGMSPVIDATELQLLGIAYRRAFGAPEMPSPELLDELAHELKDQFASNSDLRDESDWFYEIEGRTIQQPRELDARVLTTNDPGFATEPETPGRDTSPLARNVRHKIERIQRDLLRIGPGWFHVGRKCDVPSTACYVSHHGDTYVWVDADGRAALTEFTLTVLKLSTLVKETQTLISPGSVKFSPGDRGSG
ncbi:MAG TPA: hypothetical protein VHZ24_21100 [Pirellulales bacterium]|jgi:hypothetical protein|nr:hypothetical protein [Pirellulales bacterium]